MTTIYNARCGRVSWGLDRALVQVVMAQINLVLASGGRTVGWYTRFHKRRCFCSGLLISNVMGIH